MSLQDILSVDSGRRPRQRVGRGAGRKVKLLVAVKKVKALVLVIALRNGSKVVKSLCGCVCQSVVSATSVHRTEYQTVSLQRAIERVDGDVITSLH